MPASWVFSDQLYASTLLLVRWNKWNRDIITAQIITVRRVKAPGWRPWRLAEHTTLEEGPGQASHNPAYCPSPRVQCITSGALGDRIWIIVRPDKWVMPVYKAAMVFLSYVAHWSFGGFIFIKAAGIRAALLRSRRDLFSATGWKTFPTGWSLELNTAGKYSSN